MEGGREHWKQVPEVLWPDSYCICVPTCLNLVAEMDPLLSGSKSWKCSETRILLQSTCSWSRLTSCSRLTGSCAVGGCEGCLVESWELVGHLSPLLEESAGLLLQENGMHAAQYTQNYDRAPAINCLESEEHKDSPHSRLIPLTRIYIENRPEALEYTVHLTPH